VVDKKKDFWSYKGENQVKRENSLILPLNGYYLFDYKKVVVYCYYVSKRLFYGDMHRITKKVEKVVNGFCEKKKDAFESGFFTCRPDFTKLADFSPRLKNKPFLPLGYS